MAIDRETARRVAHLARIAVRAEDLDRIARELSGILTFMDQLNEVDVEGVEPMTSVTPMQAPLRHDLITDGGDAGRVLANAPARRGDFFTVPKVVE